MSETIYTISKYRKIIQAAFFVLFILLLVLSMQKISLPMPAQIFLQFDPLVTIIAFLTGTPAATAIIFSLATIIATVLFGRVFCGYVCPMGTLLDWISAISEIIPFDRKKLRKLKVLPVVILAAILIASILKIGFVMILDPISIITRATTVAYASTEVAIGLINGQNPGGLNDTGARGFGFDNPYTANYPRLFDSSGWIIGLFFVVVVLTFLSKRFWCRYLCPLGGLLGVLGRVPLYRRKVSIASCASCMKCARNCSMDAVTKVGLATDGSTCHLCLECKQACPNNAISWGLQPELTDEIPSRRHALATMGGGLAAVTLMPLTSIAEAQEIVPVRPPGVTDEELFQRKCIRCGQCLSACPTKVLQPALLQYGVDSLWTPHLNFSSGVCDYSCNECWRVCPTGAIVELTLESKQRFIIGTAQVDPNRCIRWITGQHCGECSNVCPLPINAVSFRAVYNGYGGGASVPFIDSRACIGCGVCVAACPVSGNKAIQVTGSTSSNNQLVLDNMYTQ